MSVHTCVWPEPEAGLAPFQVLTGETLQLSLGMAPSGLSQKPLPVPMARALAAVPQLRAPDQPWVELAAGPEGSSVHWEGTRWPLAQSIPRLEVTGTEPEAHGPLGSGAVLAATRLAGTTSEQRPLLGTSGTADQLYKPLLGERAPFPAVQFAGPPCIEQ